ncbi:DUF192 domain-containing protein [Natrinema salifodinae]|uniref:DUF192 domain-containing protein n=1 Tax=Natrinema salifodinae TaxID=1202768 RepID=A0A1I0QKS4_9EURY|nr:DUF192 domain-containing protein [Natrinema salifodinae]SEW27833.1 hypothetical protein SAMN05216285_3713 [Natrinema salifodinae]
MKDTWTRRHVLGLAGTVAAAGCLNAIDPSDETDEPTDGDETEPGNGTEADDGDDEESTVHADYETTEVTVGTPEGDELGEVTAAIADTDDLRFLGLSDTEELPEDRGMLFVYESVEDRTFVMREMDFGIDIIYADADGTITGIHHASEPGPDEDGNEQEYPGRGQYVLEVNYEWTSERDVSEGDVLAFDLDG